MWRRTAIGLIVLGLWLVGCSSSPQIAEETTVPSATSEVTPQPTASQRTPIPAREDVQVDDISVEVQTEQPQGIYATLRGTLASPCLTIKSFLIEQEANSFYVTIETESTDDGISDAGECLGDPVPFEERVTLTTELDQLQDRRHSITAHGISITFNLPKGNGIVTATPNPPLWLTEMAVELAMIGPHEVLQYGAQVSAHIWVWTPDHCHVPGDLVVRNDGKTFHVIIPVTQTSESDCASEIVEHEVSVPLDTSGLVPGTYALSVNGLSPIAFEIVSATPTPIPGCPFPGEGQALLLSQEGGYCVLFPAGWHKDVTGFHSPFLDGGSEPVIVGLDFHPDAPANGRSLEQVVDDWIPDDAEQDPNLTITRTPFTLDGEPAMLIEGVPSRFKQYDWLTIHNDMVYVGALGPKDVGAAPAYFDQVWQLFTSTFHWLP